MVTKELNNKQYKENKQIHTSKSNISNILQRKSLDFREKISHEIILAEIRRDFDFVNTP